VSEITLLLPTVEFASQAREYIEEHKINNSPIHGSSGLGNTTNYKEWLIKIIDMHEGVNIPAGQVAASTYFAVKKEDNKLIGTINIRHALNEKLAMYGGHIGYGIRPSERKKGYATEMLRQGINKCKELGINDILITCNNDNLGSIKTIINNGGKFQDEVFDPSDNKTTQRYWVKL
jgi:predicted acetyltransferase